MNRPTGADHGADQEHDAYLREALRHAPDAALDAPPALKDNILRQARLATAPVATERKRHGGVLHRLAAAWAWLARPPVAAGFASLMVATLVGLMWWGGPIDEAPTDAGGRAVPAAAPPPAEAPISEAKKKADALAPAVSAEPVQATPSLSKAESPPGRPKERQEREVAAATNAAAPRSDETRRQPAPPAPAQAAAVADDPSPTGLRRVPLPPPPPTRTADQLAAPPERASTERPAPGPSVQDTSAAKAAAPAATPMAAAAPPPAQEMTQERARRSDAGKPASPALASTAGASPQALGEAASPAPAPSPVATLQAAVAASPERWAWQHSRGTAQPMNETVQTWLAGLEAATRGRWQMASDAEKPPSSTSLRLWLDGRPHTQIRLDNGEVSIDVGPGRGQRAVLAPADAAALRDALEQATR